jgi:hypothetical protein
MALVVQMIERMSVWKARNGTISAQALVHSRTIAGYLCSQVAAPPRRPTTASAGALARSPPCDRDQHAVANGMAVRVVKDLEIVRVEQDQ